MQTSVDVARAIRAEMCSTTTETTWRLPGISTADRWRWRHACGEVNNSPHRHHCSRRRCGQSRFYRRGPPCASQDQVHHVRETGLMCTWGRPGHLFRRRVPNDARRHNKFKVHNTNDDTAHGSRARTDNRPDSTRRRVGRFPRSIPVRSVLFTNIRPCVYHNIDFRNIEIARDKFTPFSGKSNVTAKKKKKTE